jgi:glycosyltransferase involved in cell wall biosynthesis
MARAVFGLPMYRSEALIGEVLETLLAQDFQDFAIVAIDDGSDDGTVEVASSYAARDPRLSVESNPMRAGMIRTWNRVLARARELHPEFEFFAFASDNDPREATWLSVLIRELEQHPAAALAYSRFGVVKDGTRIPFPEKWLFDTRDNADPLERHRALEETYVGALMYGLHRRRTLDETGDVPPVLLSDILFLSHLALFGRFLQHPEVLWYRSERRTGRNVRRQRAALFGPRPPLTSYLPVSIQHTGWLARWMVLGKRRPANIGRAQAAAIAARYWARWIIRFYLDPWTRAQRRWLRFEGRKLHRRWKSVRKTLRRYRRTARAHARGAVMALAGSSAGRRINRKARGRL